LFNIAINLGQQSSTIKDIVLPILTVVITALATLLAGFGGVRYGAKITKEQKYEESFKIELNKLSFIHIYLEEYISNLNQFIQEFIKTKQVVCEKKDIKNELLAATSGYFSQDFNIQAKEYSFIVEKNPTLLTTLHMLIKWSNALQGIIQEHDSFIKNKADFGEMTVEKYEESMNTYLARVSDLVNSMYIDATNTLFLACLLYKHIYILLTQKYNFKIKNYKEGNINTIIENYKNNSEIYSEWIKGLDESWQNK